MTLLPAVAVDKLKEKPAIGVIDAGRTTWAFEVALIRVKVVIALVAAVTAAGDGKLKLGSS